MLIIDDTTSNDILFPKIDGERMGTGYDPQQAKPMEGARSMQDLFGDEPGQIKVIPASEYDARIDELEKRKATLSDIRAVAANGSLMPTLDQGTEGFCWAYSVVRLMMYLRALMNKKYKRLSAHAVGCKIKNFVNEGGWCGLSGRFVQLNGCPSVEMWPEKSMNRKYDTQETWDEAKLSLVTGAWFDSRKSDWDQDLTDAQINTLLLMGIPVAADFNWWGHSVCLKRLVRVERGVYGKNGDNSWTDGWGDRGEFTLTGSRAKADGAMAIYDIAA